jgi:hypothetical protein
MQRMASALLLGLVGTGSAAAIEPLIPEQRFPERPQLQVLDVGPGGGMVLLESSTIGRVGDTGFVWRVEAGPPRNGPLRAVRLVVDCPAAGIAENWVTHLSPAPGFAVTGHEAGSRTGVATTQPERRLLDAACSGRPLDFGTTYDGLSEALAYGRKPDWPTPQAARGDEVRRVPPDPQFVPYREGEGGSFFLLETTTMGRVGAMGYAWQLDVEPPHRYEGPVWTRLILDCPTGGIAEDWIVRLDTSLVPAGSEAAFATVTASTPDEHRLRDLVCGPAGRPAPQAVSGVAEAVLYAHARAVAGYLFR